MRIILVGASGNIGTSVKEELSKRHEIISIGSTSGDIQMDMSSAKAIRTMYERVGNFDALVCTAGHAHFGPFDEMTEEHFYKGIKGKLMGQINLVMIGKDFINPGGSFTLITGVTHNDPIKNGVGLSFVNGALHSFVMATAIELKNGIRINAVSPGLVEKSATTLGSYFPGHIPVSMGRVAQGFVKSVEGFGTGKIIEIL
jgi:NAD(P)-dependent dehydrogenase (short-subunit alcohol dehydrogenase family)